MQYHYLFVYVIRSYEKNCCIQFTSPLYCTLYRMRWTVCLHFVSRPSLSPYTPKSYVTVKKAKTSSKVHVSLFILLCIWTAFPYFFCCFGHCKESTPFHFPAVYVQAFAINRLVAAESLTVLL